jgi:hypothetical protein
MVATMVMEAVVAEAAQVVDRVLMPVQAPAVRMMLLPVAVA